MSVKDLFNAGKAVYKTVNDSVAKATGDSNTLSNNINKLATGIKNGLIAEKAENEEKYPTFDPSSAKSTVVNPSTKFPGISKQDEQKIYDIVNSNYAGASDFEKNQATQGLYKVALERQRAKDIEAGRQEVKIEYMQKAENAKSTKEKNTYNSEVKKADLADLIKMKLSNEGVDVNQLINITDDGIIAGFVESNPEYEKPFNRYFYSKSDATQLGKDLGWIEKTTKDKAIDKVKGFGEGMVGWIDKFGEGVADTLNLAGGEKESAGFENYVQDNYGTAIANLTDADLKKAKEAYANANKKEYEPSVASAATKLAEGATDIVFTSGGLKGANLLKNNLFKAGFSAAAETPVLEYGPEFLGETLGTIGTVINKIPGFSDIRDNLQTEQEKADWDAFVGGNVLALLRGGKRTAKDVSNIDINGIKDAFDKAKQGNIIEGANAIKENINENKAAKINEQKIEKAQQITQGDINTRGRESAGLDYLDEKGKLKNVKSTEDLTKVIDEEIDSLKKEQTDAATKDKKKYGENDILTEEEVEVLNENGEKTTQLKPNRAFSKLIDEIIEHYEDIDSAKATTYKSYKKAFQNGKLPMDVALEIKREGNNLGQNTFTKKSQIPKNSEKAEGWNKMMKSVNEAFDKLDIGEDIRSRDSKLSSLYSIKNNLSEVERRAADMEKKAVKKTGLEKIGSTVGNTIGKFINKISFGLSSLGTKAIVSLLSGMLGDLKMAEKTSYTPVEIKARIPEFIKDYHELNEKLNGKTINKTIATKLVNAWIDKWQSTMEYNEED